jgi:hypothetical protein
MSASIVHLSIPAAEPKRVARVLAEVMRGRVTDFRPVAGAFYVATDTATAIEVYPERTAMKPGRGEDGAVRMMKRRTAPDYGALHIALTAPLSRRLVMAIGRREGWRAVPCRRGNSFNVIELWLENRLMLEVIATEDQAEAIEALTPA